MRMGSFGGDHLKLKTKKGKPYTQQHVISRLVPVIYSPLLCNNLFTWVYYDYLSQKEPQNMPQKKALHQIMKGCVRLNLLFFYFRSKSGSKTEGPNIRK